MKKIITFLLVAALFAAGTDNASAKKKKVTTGSQDREYWVESLVRIVDPVFVNLSQNTLRQNMPVETPASPSGTTMR